MTLTSFSESPAPLERSARPAAGASAQPAQSAPAAQSIPASRPGAWTPPVASEVSAPRSVAAPVRPALAFPTIKTTAAADLAPAPELPGAAPLGSQPIPVLSRSVVSQSMPIVLPPPGAAAHGAIVGPIVRLPRALGTDAVVDVSMVGDLQVVRIRGRITESFKGEPLGRTLGPRVVFDLAEVDRVTSFGVREWLAMMTSATQMTEATFLRCSEAVVNQLTMIRKFDGGARIASFFAPYLCGNCGATLECLRDCERDAAELASYAPSPIHCPRCDGEARFDDDARSYFAFATAHLGVALPPEVRAIADALALQSAAQPAEEIEKQVGDDGTRIRVLAKLTSHLRWRKIFDGIEGVLILDLSATPASDAAGVTNLEQSLRTLPPEVVAIRLESAPALLVERALRGADDRLQVVSAAVNSYCRACAVNRPATLHVERYSADANAGREHQVVCKRCNGNLDLVLDGPVLQLVELTRRRLAASLAPQAAAPAERPPLVHAPPAPALVSASYPAMTPPPAPRRGVSLGVALLLVALAATVGALIMSLRKARAPEAERGGAALALAAQPEPAATKAASAPTWQASADLPPAWTERALTTEGDVLYVVGRTALPEASSAGLEAGLEAARQAATVLLLEQIEAELEGSPVHAFVAARTRRDAADARPAIAARFLTQHGQALALTRAEVATHKRESGTELYVRYRVPRAQVDAVRASYRATFKFRGLELALFFPVLETALHAEGQLIVIAVDRRSGAALAGVREGDVLLSVAGAPVTTLDSFRTTANNAWVNLEPRGRLSLEFESAGARKTVTLMKPAPQP